ncbi:MAG: ATP-binding cassette domain-containing protein, partial [Cyanobacteria bacterium J06648_11]
MSASHISAEARPAESVPDTQSSPAIAVSGLSHYFGRGPLRKQILFDVTFEIARGEVVILMGPSGSGKTTILTLVGGLRSAQEGSLKILGQEL